MKMMKKSLIFVGICFFVATCLFCGISTAQDEDEQLAGGWSTYQALDSVAKKVFDEAVKDILGVKYTPFCVSEQVVAGKNYCFLCLSVTVTKEPLRGNAYIEVFVDFDEKAGKPKITPIPHKQLPGGYSIYEPVTGNDKALLQAVEVPGFTYTPFCVAKQGGVQGGNPKYFCEGKAVVPEPVPENDFVTLHVQDSAKPKIAETVKVKQKELPYVLDDPRKKAER